MRRGKEVAGAAQAKLVHTLGCTFHSLLRLARSLVHREGLAVLTGNESLRLVGTRVEFLGIDTQITLRFSNNAVVRLESAFSLTSDGAGECFIDPDGDKGHFVPVLRLLHETVAAARIEDSTLEIEFSEGSILTANPDDDYESWSYAGPEMPPNRIIALPGGELAIWSSSEASR